MSKLIETLFTGFTAVALVATVNYTGFKFFIGFGIGLGIGFYILWLIGTIVEWVFHLDN